MIGRSRGAASTVTRRRSLCFVCQSGRGLVAGATRRSGPASPVTEARDGRGDPARTSERGLSEIATEDRVDRKGCRVTVPHRSVSDDSWYSKVCVCFGRCRFPVHAPCAPGHAAARSRRCVCCKTASCWGRRVVRKTPRPQPCADDGGTAPAQRRNRSGGKDESTDPRVLSLTEVCPVRRDFVPGREIPSAQTNLWVAACVCTSKGAQRRREGMGRLKVWGQPGTVLLQDARTNGARGDGTRPRASVSPLTARVQWSESHLHCRPWPWP